MTLPGQPNCEKVRLAEARQSQTSPTAMMPGSARVQDAWLCVIVAGCVCYVSQVTQYLELSN